MIGLDRVGGRGKRKQVRRKQQVDKRIRFKLRRSYEDGMICFVIGKEERTAKKEFIWNFSG